MDIYDRIDAILQEKHMSRRQLAREAGVSYSTFAAAFSRRSKLSFENITKIANTLQVSPQELEPSFKFIADLHKDAEILRDDYDSQIKHFAALGLFSAMFQDDNLLQSIEQKEHDPKTIYDILAAVWALNKEGQSKVLEYVMDLNRIIPYRRKGVRMVANRLINSAEITINEIMDILNSPEALQQNSAEKSNPAQEVTPCPEEELPTAAEHSPVSDPTDAGK